MNQKPQVNGNEFNPLLRGASNHLLGILIMVGVAVTYFFAAKLGLSVAYIHGNVSPVWPPTGVAIAAVLLLGYRVWPAILVGAFFANVFTHVTIATAGGIAIGNTLEAITAGLLLNSLGFNNSLDRARDVSKFILAALVCPMLSATVGNLSLCLSGAARWEDFGALWRTWWLGDMVGALVIAPLLLTLGTKPRKTLSTRRYLEGSLLLTLLSVSSIATFVGPTQIPLKYYPATRLIVPFFLWAAFRFGQRGVTLGTLIMSVFAVWGTPKGLGPFAGRSPNDSLMVLQLYLGTNVAMFLFLAATVEERRVAAETLRESERRVAANLAITQILAESPALGHATKRILETIGETLDWRVADMWTPDSEGKSLRCLVFWHSPSTSVDQFESVCRTYAFEYGVGLPGRVWMSLKPTWIPDVARDDNFPRASFAVGSGLHSAFAFPIVFGGKFLGVMEFFSDQIREPDEALLGMFDGIGNQIGQFIERKRAEDEREQLLAREHAARAEAELANRSKDEFLAMVSHELRTPLSAIVGWSNMLRSGRLDENTSSRAIEVIDRNAKVQAQIIEDLLDVSRIVSGNLRIDPRPVELQQVIEAAIDSVRPAADSKKIQLLVKLDEQVGPVLGDSGRLQQVVWNLLSNAVKFTPSSGEINVQLTHAGSEVEISVSDTGQGIEAEFLPQVFDRFRQADSSKSRRHGGLGLGLAIVRNLVKLHGGNVIAESEGDGKGTTFTIRLPTIGEGQEGLLRQDQGDMSPAFQLEPSQLAGLRILTVDDDPDLREMIVVILQSQGADVVSVGSVPEALKILDGDQWKPEVLLSDLGMPGQDGYELIRDIRSRKAEKGGTLPAIAITGYAGLQEGRRSLNAGFQAHLTKPLNWSLLVTTIRTHVKKQSPEQENGKE